jgi:hypothetical protein
MAEVVWRELEFRRTPLRRSVKTRSSRLGRGRAAGDDAGRHVSQWRDVSFLIFLVSQMLLPNLSFTTSARRRGKRSPDERAIVTRAGVAKVTALTLALTRVKGWSPRPANNGNHLDV